MSYQFIVTTTFIPFTFLVLTQFGTIINFISIFRHFSSPETIQPITTTKKVLSRSRPRSLNWVKENLCLDCSDCSLSLFNFAFVETEFKIHYYFS